MDQSKITTTLASISTKTKLIDSNNKYTLSRPYSCSNMVLNSGRLALSMGTWKDSVLEDLCSWVLATYYNETDPVLSSDVLKKLKDILAISAHVYGVIVSLWKNQNYRHYIDSLKRPLNILLGAKPEESMIYYINTAQASHGRFGPRMSNDVWANDILANLEEIYITKELREYITFLVGNVHKLKADDSTVRLVNINEAEVYFIDGPANELENDVQQALYLSDNIDNVKTLLNTEVELIKASINKYPFLVYVLKHMQAWHVTENDIDLTRDLKGKTIHVWEDRDGSFESMIYDAVSTLADYAHYNEFRESFKPAFKAKGVKGMVSSNFGDSILFRDSYADPSELAECDKYARTIVTRFALTLEAHIYMNYFYRNGTYESEVKVANPYYLELAGYDPNAQGASDITIADTSKAQTMYPNDNVAYQVISAVSEGGNLLIDSHDWAVYAGARDYIIDEDSMSAIYNQSGIKQFYPNLSVPTGATNNTKY